MKKKSAKKRPKKTKRETWQLREHGISPSGIEKYLDDRESFRIAYKLGMVSQVMPKGIVFGGACHHVLDQFNKLCLKGKTESVIDWIEADSMMARIRKWVAEFEKTLGPRSHKPEVNEHLLGLAEVTMNEYFRYYIDDLIQRERIASEQKFRFWVNGIPVCGTLDAVDDWGRRVGVWVEDTKTGIVSDLADEAYANGIQFRVYMLAHLHIFGALPEGLVLNTIRRCGFSITKADGDLPTHLNRVKKDIQERPDYYFSRKDITTSEESLLHWEAETLAPMLKEIDLWERGEIPHYANPSALISYAKRSEYWEAITENDFSKLTYDPYWKSYETVDIESDEA